MTTASRPTFDPARGGKSKFESDMTALTKHYSSRDLPGHTTVKYREPPAQSSTSLKRDLEARERGVKVQSGASAASSSSTSQSTAAKRTRTELLVVPSSANPDADDPNVIDKDDDEAPSRRPGVSKTTDDDDDDEEEDETALLLAELERIKKEREIETTKREAERQAEEERAREEALVRGNPLLNGPLGAAGGAASFTVKKRWDDDTVFKNCARGVEDAAAKRKRVGYVNDTLRSEFHKRFMDKFIK